MPPLVLKNYEQILQQMTNVVVARTRLNDVTDSSVFKHTLAAPAREIDEVYFQLGNMLDLFSLDTAVGDDLDARAAEVAGITRVHALKAVGEVVFGRTGVAGTVTILAGTQVKTPAGIAFVTLVNGTIADGNSTSDPVSSIASVAGASGNVSPATIIKFDSKPAGVDTVTNQASFVGGQDQESDDDFRRRIRAYIQSLSRSTPQALEFASIGVSVSNGQRVAFAHVVEDDVNRGEVTLYVDDGAGTAETSAVVTSENVTAGLGGPGDTALGGEEFLALDHGPIKPGAAFTLSSDVWGTLVRGTVALGAISPANADYVLDEALHIPVVKLLRTPQTTSTRYATGAANGETITATTYTYFTGLLGEVQKVIDGDAADRTNYPGFRAAGIRVHVLPPTILQQLVIASVVVKDGFTKGLPLVGGGYTAGSVLAEVADAIANHINSLGVSGDVLVAKLIEVAMEVPGVQNIFFSSPAFDVVVLDEQLMRSSIGNITLT